MGNERLSKFSNSDRISFQVFVCQTINSWFFLFWCLFFFKPSMSIRYSERTFLTKPVSHFKCLNTIFFSSCTHFVWSNWSQHPWPFKENSTKVLKWWRNVYINSHLNRITSPQTQAGWVPWYTGFSNATLYLTEGKHKKDIVYLT